MSSTVVKALSILEHLSEEDPQLGLSELARRAKIDKATAHRMLTVMVEAGMVEQSGNSKLYRLGAGVLRLARAREDAFPVTTYYQNALERLVEETNETAHASLISGRNMATIAVVESARTIRVSLIAGEILPFHSTGSGIAALAFGEPKLVDKILSSPMDSKTDKTVTDIAGLNAQLEKAKNSGFAIGDETNEEGVYGIAAPVFGPSGFAAGAIAVATPASRMNEEHKQTAISALLKQANRLSLETGGRIPPNYLDLTSK